MRRVRDATSILMMCLGLGFGMSCKVRASDVIPVIAAASDLQFALTAVADAFRKETGKDVRIAFGSSGNFARQIRLKAPFQIFFSADEDYVLALSREGFTSDDGVVYAIGRLALVVPRNSSIMADSALVDVGVGLKDGRLKRFAIANPEHAPYGKRAQEVLERAGLWLSIKDKLVLGENVSQAGQFAISGSTDGGIIAYSLALSPKISDVAHTMLLPETLHSALRQRMVLLKDAGEIAQSFYAFAGGVTAREIFGSFGFVRPDGSR